MKFDDVTTIELPEGEVEKITCDDLLLWEKYDIVITPYNGNKQGYIAITKVPVSSGDVLTITYYLTKRQGYIYDGRNVGLNYYGSVSSTKYPMSSDDVGKISTLTITAESDGYIMISGYYLHTNNVGNLSTSEKDRCYGFWIKVKIN